jgi:plasmid stabilization system protein ParE
MNFRLLTAARSDLDDIDAWVSEHFSPTVALKTQQYLFSTFERLIQFPGMGPETPGS